MPQFEQQVLSGEIDFGAERPVKAAGRPGTPLRGMVVALPLQGSKLCAKRRSDNGLLASTTRCCTSAALPRQSYLALARF